MSGFFRQNVPTPPSSWWTHDVARTLLGVDDAGEEASMRSPEPDVADVIGHDLATVAMPLFADVDLDAETKTRFGEALSQMLPPETILALAQRQFDATGERLCPAGLLFLPPRAPQAEPADVDTRDSEPLALDFQSEPTDLRAAEAALLIASVANLAGQTDLARQTLGCIGRDGLDAGGPLEALLQREREATALLSGDRSVDLKFGYHRVLAYSMGWQKMDAAAIAEVVDSMDSRSPWRWASLRLVLPVLLDSAPDVLANLMSEGA